MRVVTYSCNLCRESISDDNGGVGVNFSGMMKFRLSSLYATDGQHICLSCLQQLKEQLPEVNFKENPND